MLKKIQNHLIPIKYSNCAFSETHYSVIQRDQIGGDFVFIYEDEKKYTLLLWIVPDMVFPELY